MNSEGIIKALRERQGISDAKFLSLVNQISAHSFASLDDVLLYVVREFRLKVELPAISSYEAAEIGRNLLDQAYPQGADAAHLDFTLSQSGYFGKLLFELLLEEYTHRQLHVYLTQTLSRLSWSEQHELVKEIQRAHYNRLSEALAQAPAHLFVDHLPDLLLQISQTEHLIAQKLPSVLSQNS